MCYNYTLFIVTWYCNYNNGIEDSNLIWPIVVKPWIKKINTKNWNIIWTINLKEDWFKKFNSEKIYIKDLVTNINYSPNFIKIKALNLLTDELMKLSVITFKEYF